MAGDDPALDRSETDNNLESKREAQERTLHIMAKVHDFLDMWQGRQNLRTTQKNSRAQNMQMTAVGYTSDTEEIVKASWLLFQHDYAAAFKLSDRSPLQPALSANELAGGRTQVFNACRIRRIDPHPAESDHVSAPKSISDTDTSLNWNGDLDNPNESEDHCEADNESNVVLDNYFENAQCPEQQAVCAAPNVPGLIRSTQNSRKEIDKVSLTVTATETWRIRGNRKKWDRMGQYVFSRFFMLLDQEFHLE